jgi:hypothetical protein
VFNIDGRFFGTIIAYVAGAPAAGYDFTSGLPVQLLKVLAPQLMPLINGGAGDAALPGACVNGVPVLADNTALVAPNGK